MTVENTKATLQGINAKVDKMTKTSSVANTSEDNKVKKTHDKKKCDPREDGVLMGKRYRSQTLPFLLTFKIFHSQCSQLSCRFWGFIKCNALFSMQEA